MEDQTCSDTLRVHISVALSKRLDTISEEPVLTLAQTVSWALTQGCFGFVHFSPFKPARKLASISFAPVLSLSIFPVSKTILVSANYLVWCERKLTIVDQEDDVEPVDDGAQGFVASFWSTSGSHISKFHAVQELIYGVVAKFFGSDTY